MMKHIKHFSLFLILPLLMAGCNTALAPAATTIPVSGVTDSPTPATESTPAPEPTPIPTPVPTPIPGPASEEMLGLLPAEAGYTWEYDGCHEYVHTMTLDSIRTDADGLVRYNITGWVENMPHGASKPDPAIVLTYTVGANCIVQEKEPSDMIDSRYDRLELIRGPLEQGTSWEQTVYDRDGKSVNLTCTINYIEERTPGTVYYVEYRDKERHYVEDRCIQEGVGVTYASRPDVDQGFVYGLYSCIEIFNGELGPYIPPLDTDLAYTGPGGFTQTGRLTHTWTRMNETVYTFDGAYQDEQGSAPFQIRYYVDYNRDTVTERVMSNARTGVAEVHSKLHNLVILMLPMQLPLRQGFVWNHEAVIDGQPCRVQAEAVVCDLDAGIITVRYTAQDAAGYHKNTYIEERTFERGYGMTSFKSLLPGDIVMGEGQTEEQAIADHMFTYTLVRD